MAALVPPCGPIINTNNSNTATIQWKATTGQAVPIALKQLGHIIAPPCRRRSNARCRWHQVDPALALAERGVQLLLWRHLNVDWGGTRAARRTWAWASLTERLPR